MNAPPPPPLLKAPGAQVSEHQREPELFLGGGTRVYPNRTLLLHAHQRINEMKSAGMGMKGGPF